VDSSFASMLLLVCIVLTACFAHRLVFSQSLLSLDLIEAFLAHWDKEITSADDEVSTCYM